MKLYIVRVSTGVTVKLTEFDHYDEARDYADHIQQTRGSSVGVQVLKAEEVDQ